MTLAQALLLLAGAGAVLIGAGVVLAGAADTIGDRTRIGKVWIGTMLVATATSLPELTVDVSAARMGSADLGAGDLFGSSMANMLLLAIVRLVVLRAPAAGSRRLDHVHLAILAIALNALAAAFVLLRPTFALFGVTPHATFLLVAYAGGVRALYRRQRPDLPRIEVPPPARSLRGAIVRYVVAAIVILLCAPWFVRAAESLAEISGLGSTFIGTFLVGIGTSLPELSTSLAAARLGSIDLAIGNLFGSNAFNMAIFFAMDVATPESVFARLDPAHAIAASFATVLMGLALASVVTPRRSPRRLRAIELLIVAGYLAAAGSLYLARS